LTPLPKSSGGSDQAFGFSGPVNTTAQGNPVPIGYGRLIVGSVVISAEILASDIAVNYVPPTAGGVGGGIHGNVP